MTDLPNAGPSVLLLGYGYTLQYVAKLLGPKTFVAASRSNSEKIGLHGEGYGARINTAQSVGLAETLANYPSITTIVDSIPPLHEHSGSALDGVEYTLRAARNSAIQRVIYLSTTGVFGEESGAWVSEATQPLPKSEAAKLRLESEQRYASEKIPATSIRISGIYGPGRGIGLALRAKRYQLIEGERWSNRIHVEDLASVIAAAIKHPAPPTVLCASDDHPALAREVVRFYCEKFQLEEPKAITLEQARKSCHHTQLSNQRVSNERMKGSFGVVLRHPSYISGAGCEFSLP